MHRNTITILLSVGLTLGFASQPLRAATSGLFTYTDNGTSITITGYPTSAAGNVTIPATIIGKPVITINMSAFAQCTKLTAVTIPDSVKSIGDVAFNGCTSMTRVTIGSGITTIGNQAFGYCSALTTVIIPNSVINIGNNAFYYCVSLSSVTIGSGVVSIGNEALYGCDKLTGVTIPASVTSICNGVFDECHTLAVITVDPANRDYSSVSGVLFNKLKTSLIRCPEGEVVEVIGLSGIHFTSIGAWAFMGCSHLIGVSLSASFTSIGTGAFYACTNLTSITIPAGVTSIGDNAFYDCSSLTSATFLGKAPTMGAAVFDSVAAGFQVDFITGKTGFTTPTWLGYPTQGVAAAPDIDVQCPLLTHLVSGTAKKSFGTVKIGLASTAKTFTITNIGTANLTCQPISYSGNAGDFSIVYPKLSTLTPGYPTTFKMTFNPVATGTRTATIFIVSNDPDEKLFTIQITGMGAP